MKHQNSAVLAEEIHAFIDDELTMEDRQRVRRSIKKSPELAQMVCDIDQIRDWVREAYQDVPGLQPRRTMQSLRLRVPRTAVAASLVMVGALAGWLAAKNIDEGGVGTVAPIALEQPLSSIGSSSHMMPVAQHQNVLLRLSSGSPKKFKETLSVAEKLLRNGSHKPGFELEVLTNSEGLNLLRSTTSPYARQIEALIARYPNVHFLVCGTSLANLKKMGEKPDLLPNVHVTPSAVEKVVQRLREGWQYYSI